MTLFRRTLAALLSLSLAFGGTAYATPAAGLIGTEQAARALQSPAGQPGEAQSRLMRELQREELAAALRERGVSVAALRERVASLTDDEARTMLAQIDSAPAGADIVGVLFTVFIILLVTDILGLTKVFPFTRPIR